MNNLTNDTFNYVTSISALSGFILYHIRDQMGVNQREIASIFDITHTTYGNMERGDTAVNADFIYMLCTLVGIRFSDYFMLLEDLIIHLEQTKSGNSGEKININIIPSSDLQKIITEHAKSGFSIPPSIENSKNLLIGQDIKFFLSNELKERLSVLSQVRLNKEQIREMINLKSSEVEEALQIIKKIDSTQALAANNIATAGILGRGTLAFTSGVGSGLLTSLTLGAVASAAAFPITSAIAGYGLYKAYKQTKEEKKSNK